MPPGWMAAEAPEEEGLGRWRPPGSLRAQATVLVLSPSRCSEEMGSAVLAVGRAKVWGWAWYLPIVASFNMALKKVVFTMGNSFRKMVVTRGRRWLFYSFTMYIHGGIGGLMVCCSIVTPLPWHYPDL